MLMYNEQIIFHLERQPFVWKLGVGVWHSVHSIVPVLYRISAELQTLEQSPMESRCHKQDLHQVALGFSFIELSAIFSELETALVWSYLQ